MIFGIFRAFFSEVFSSLTNPSEKKTFSFTLVFFPEKTGRMHVFFFIKERNKKKEKHFSRERNKIKEDFYEVFNQNYI